MATKRSKKCEFPDRVFLTRHDRDDDEPDFAVHAEESDVLALHHGTLIAEYRLVKTAIVDIVETRTLQTLKEEKR